MIANTLCQESITKHSKLRAACGLQGHCSSCSSMTDNGIPSRYIVRNAPRGAWNFVDSKSEQIIEGLMYLPPLWRRSVWSPAPERVGWARRSWLLVRPCLLSRAAVEICWLFWLEGFEASRLDWLVLLMCRRVAEVPSLPDSSWDLGNCSRKKNNDQNDHDFGARNLAKAKKILQKIYKTFEPEFNQSLKTSKP